MDRLSMVLTEADKQGIIVIVQFFYFGQTKRWNGNNDTIYNATDNIIRWLLDTKLNNFIIEVVNECNNGEYQGTPLYYTEVGQLIQYVQNKCDNKFYVGTSYAPGHIPDDEVIKISDFILLHGNGQSPQKVASMVQDVRNSNSYTAKPILFNEDKDYKFNATENNMKSAIENHASWGFMAVCNGTDDNNYFNAYQCPPVAWDINTNVKKSFFEALVNYTKS